MQGIFQLQHEQKNLLHDYIITPYNEEVYNSVMQSTGALGQEPFKHFLVLCGTTQSGKTHLASIWAKKFQATFLDISYLSLDLAKYHGFVIDDIHLLPAHELLHLFNLINELNKPCLLNTIQWPLNNNLRDLQSRLLAVKVLEFKTPDYLMVYRLIAQQLELRNLQVAQGVIQYLCLRLPADLNTILTAIKLLDESSLIEQANITIPFIKKVLNLP